MAALSPAVAVDGFESSRSSYSSCASFSSVSVISVSRFLLQRAMNVKLVLWVVALVEAILCNSHEGCAVGILLLAPYPCFLQGKRLLLQCEVRHPVKIEIVDFFDFGACNAEESTGDTCTPSKPLSLIHISEPTETKGLEGVQVSPVLSWALHAPKSKKSTISILTGCRTSH